MGKLYKKKNLRKKREKRKQKRKDPIFFNHKFKNGVYHLGLGGNYTLSEIALKHILEGDFSERLLEENNRRTGKKEIILTGGLHTYNAWINFKNLRNDIVHLRFYNSSTDRFWYYARELHNGVITLKLPREYFQSKAANITKFPDRYYKSGYLWKTLFPKNKTTDDILKIINQALHNLDREESTDRMLIGYALVDHPFTAIKIRIQCFDNQINSAFPCWDQPMTGNNGKAYSHNDSTSFLMAASTEFFDDAHKLYSPPKSNIYDHNIGVSSLIKNTPDFLLNRPRIEGETAIKEWHKQRESHIKNLANSVDEKTILKMLVYLKDPCICKDGFMLQRDAYQHLDLLKEREFFNAISIQQNIIETLIFIFYFDRKHKTLHLIDAILHYLKNKVTFSGFIDSWNNKRLHSKILKLVSSYHSGTIIPQYLEALSLSPTRNDLSLEFDLNRYWKKELDLHKDDSLIELSLMHHPNMEINLCSQHFRDFALNNLSENYLLNFDRNYQNKFLDQVLVDMGKNAHVFIEDCVKITVCDDFTFFSELFEPISERIIQKEINNIDENALAILIKDFFRVQCLQRMKILYINNEFNLFDIDYSNLQSEKYRSDMIVKHERRVKVIMLELFLSNCLKICDYLNLEDLSSEVEKYKERVWTEKPPMPTPIPDYIKHWKNNKDQSWRQDLDIYEAPEMRQE